MARTRKGAQVSTEQEIDSLVVSQAEDESACEAPVWVERSGSFSLSLPAELAGRAAFLARLHREESVETWLQRVISERIDIEEAALADAKRDLAARSRPS